MLLGSFYNKMKSFNVMYQWIFWRELLDRVGRRQVVLSRWNELNIVVHVALLAVVLHVLVIIIPVVLNLGAFFVVIGLGKDVFDNLVNLEVILYRWRWSRAKSWTLLDFICGAMIFSAEQWNRVLCFLNLGT